MELDGRACAKGSRGYMGCSPAKKVRDWRSAAALQYAAPMSSLLDERAMLRHTLATLAYRAEKVLRDPPSGFAQYKIGPSSRTPLEIVGHLGDLIEWAQSLADGQRDWKAASIGEWDAEVARFFTALSRLDERLASSTPLGKPAPLIFQAPIADAFTHVGQLALLRGLAGKPVRPESYAGAEIEIGRVGRAQSEKRREFDGDASQRR